MKHLRPGHPALAALVAVVLLGGSASATMPPPTVTFTTTTLAASATDDDSRAVIDGRLVAWQHYAGTEYSIAVRNLATGQTRYIGATGATIQQHPDVSGDFVVYEDNTSGSYDIKLYRWSTDSVSTIASTANNERDPKIDGTLIVWQDENTGYLWYVDLDVGGLTRITAAGDNAVEHEVDNGKAYWSIPDPFRDIRFAQLRPPGIAGQLTSFGLQPEFLECQGERAVWGFSDGNAMQYDIRSRYFSTLAGTSEYEGQPTPFHDTSAWLWSDGGLTAIVYNRPGHLATTLSHATETYQGPSLYGHRMVWNRADGSDWDVVMGTATTKLAARTSGTNRYATAAAVSAAYFRSGQFVLPQYDNVVLCTGEGFPDALAAAPLARALGAPLLLTRRTSVPPETLAEITRLAPAKIYIIGGDPAISTAVENQLKATYTTERLAGTDRYDTSAKIATELGGIMGPTVVKRAFFARGDAFPDALAIGPVAACANAPVLLVRTNAVPASVATVVDDLDIQSGAIAGGTSAVSGTTMAQLKALLQANGS